MQEKFQVVPPDNLNDDAHSGWKSDASARRRHGVDGQDAVQLPPGMDIDAQKIAPRDSLPMTMGGESDVSADYNATSVRQGYERKRARPTDDEYTKAHQDAFYDEITVDGDTGFAERNNMLDRL